MKALVTYYSQTGNTEKVAHAIYEAIPTAKELKPIRKVETSAGYEIIFCGFPVLAHSVPEKAQPFITGLPAGQKIAFFSTHGSLRGGRLPKQAFDHAIGLAARATILGHFGCRGRVDQNIIDALMQKPEHKTWAEEAQSAEGHPDKGDMEDAATFAREMMAKIRL